MTSFDFDNDGDLDVISSVVGMYYSGSAWDMKTKMAN